MRIQSIIWLLIPCLFFVSCQNSDKDRLSKTNLEIARGLTSCIINNELDKLGNYLAVDAINHAGLKGDAIGLDAIKQDLQGIHAMASDLKVQVLKELADSEYVMQWLRFSGISTAAARGIEPGKTFESTTVQVLRFRDGLVVEHWEFKEPRELLKMLNK